MCVLNKLKGFMLVRKTHYLVRTKKNISYDKILDIIDQVYQADDML